LRQEERIGIILFDHEAVIFEPIKKVSKLDIEELISRVSKITERGSTNMELGMGSAVRMLTDLLEEDPDSTSNQNRIIFLTDANPNVGGGENSLIGISEKASRKDIFTTFIGVGLDFNTEIVTNISKVRGGLENSN
jgi:Ca-activated chloride channel homolog